MSDTQISHDAPPAWPWSAETEPETDARLVDQGPQEGPDRPNVEEKGRAARAPLWIVAVVAALIGASVSGGVLVATRGTKTKVVGPATVTASASAPGSSSAPPVASGSEVRDVLAKVEPAV